MKVTKQDAKQKWCPFSRVATVAETPNLGVAGCNRTPNATEPGVPLQIEGSKCIAEKCMAWRWANPPAHETEPGTATGYCGLAGVVTD